MALIDINENTVTKIDTEFVNPELLEWKIRQLEAAYIEWISFLCWIDKVIAYNNPEVEAEAENIKTLEIQKKNVEASMADTISKIKFLKSIL